MAKKNAALLVIVLMLGGCAGSGSHADDGTYRKRALCQETSIGSDAKSVCY
ncbi:hypothetical protein [Beijerinckia sp. L45]|uniref:hypothetical protein n=1 Tax=Beijerinckia sp. L45 TaxID=1641855 RepID=UPI00131E23C4|nr:hypothetical protein [Beijerinckia sp. L45]